MPTNDDTRYARHLALDDFGSEGQQRLSGASALIVGLGGLGTPAALYLTAAGIGELILCDFDTVDLSNLQRQILFRTTDVGRPKTEASERTLSTINPDVRFTLVSRRPGATELLELLERVDTVLDGSDNFGTRYAVNSAAVETGTALISGAAIRYEGQLVAFANNGTGPCYRCLFDESDEAIEDCSGNGVLGPVAGLIGTRMAIDVLRHIVHGELDDGVLRRFNARTGRWSESHLSRDAGCPVCAVERVT